MLNPFKLLNFVNGEEYIVEGTHCLVATGRQANISQLNLMAAGIKASDSGIIVNPRLQTSNRRVYAVGDVINTYNFTHAAEYEAGIVIKNIIFGLRAKVDYRALPWVTYTEPELAHVGHQIGPLDRLTNLDIGAGWFIGILFIGKDIDMDGHGSAQAGE